MANRAKQSWADGRSDIALKSLMRAQNILAEMMSTVDLDGGKIVNNVLAIDEFIYRNLVRAGSYRDEKALADAIRVLERERDNWRLVCEKLSAAESALSRSESTLRAPHFSLFSDFDSAVQGGFSVEA
jgi:flagellar protein FliS